MTIENKIIVIVLLFIILGIILSVAWFIAGNNIGYDKGYERGYNFAIDLYGLKEKSIKCKYCDKGIRAKDINIYIAKGCRTSQYGNITFYDAYDCPNCGGQNILGERLEVK